MVALYIGVLGVFSQQIDQLLSNPSIEIKIKESTIAEVFTFCNELKSERSYNLTIRNTSNVPIQKIKVKIRQKEEASWLNLIRPLSNIFEINLDNNESKKIESIDEFYINNLSPKDDDDFNLGFYGTDNNGDKKFILTTQTCINMNNQTIRTTINEKHKYFLEIVADNMLPQYVEIILEIDHLGNLKISPEINKYFVPHKR